MNYWLVKSEPHTYSWQNMTSDGEIHWDGVRNFQARNNLMKMKVGDRVLFYHSGESREVVGVVTVSKEHYPDPSDDSGKFVMVNVKFESELQNPVTLRSIKSNPALVHMPLIKQSRLSVMPLSIDDFNEIIKMSKMA
jgi:predicted RNA-binding protein with PUA-like domain